MARKRLSDFAQSDLITPQTLQTDSDVLLRANPKWAESAELVTYREQDPDGSFDLMVVSIYRPRNGGPSAKTSARDDNSGPWSVTLSDYAAFLEVTRYGNNIIVGTNGKAGAPGALFYPKMTFTGFPNDKFPLTRLIIGAGPNEQVKQREKGQEEPARLFTHNLHPFHLGREPAAKPQKDARSLAIFHALRCAERAGISASEVQDYISNIHNLYAYHDALYELT